MFCRTVPENFVGESVFVSIISAIEKVRDKRRGGNQDFLSKIFRLTVPNHFEVESLSVSLLSGIEKVFG